MFTKIAALYYNDPSESWDFLTINHNSLLPQREKKPQKLKPKIGQKFPTQNEMPTLTSMLYYTFF